MLCEHRKKYCFHKRTWLCFLWGEEGERNLGKNFKKRGLNPDIRVKIDKLGVRAPISLPSREANAAWHLCARLQLTEPALENILWGGAQVKAKRIPSGVGGEASSANFRLSCNSDKDPETCLKFMGAHSSVPQLLQTHLTRNNYMV